MPYISTVTPSIKSFRSVSNPDVILYYRISYKKATKTIHEKVYGSLKEARAELEYKKTELKHSKRDKKELMKKSLTLQEYADIYFPNRLTLNNANDQARFNNHLPAALKSKKLKSITQQDIQDLQTKLLKKIKPATVDSVVSVLRALMNHATTRGTLKESDNIFLVNNDIKLMSDTDETKRDRIFNTTEFNQLLEQFTDKPRIYLLLNTLHESGARISQTLQIKVKDISYDNSTINYPGAKGAGAYKNYIPDVLLQDMKEHIEDYNLQPDHYIFFKSTRLKSQPMEYKLVHSTIQPVMNELFNQGLEKSDSKHRAVIHTLRHTYATNLVNAAGSNLFECMEQLNHKDIKTTKRYYKSSKANKLKTVNNAITRSRG